MKSKFLLLVSIILFNVACNQRNKMYEGIKKTEAELMANIINLDKAKAQDLITKSEAFVKQFPQDTVSAELLFKAGEVSKGIGDYDNALRIWSSVHTKYKESKFAPIALFLQGLMIDDEIKDKPRAKKYYEDFISQYPNHQFTQNARELLSITSDEEFIRNAERKNKKEIEGE